MGYLLDTNIVTAFLKNHPLVRRKLSILQIEQAEVFISCITYFEVKRGLLAVNATRQLSDFNLFCTRVRFLLLDDIEIIDRASEIHANLKSRGTPIQDADILIAATAMTRGLILVSNDSDLLRVQGIN
jgi:tRNA(fMet)-specific endonuclease VapC